MNKIKNLKPNLKSGYVQGYYPIQETKKYKGKGPIIYRSSWERKFCIYCERTPEIDYWSSESFSIKYFNPIDKKYHQYFPDFFIHLKSGENVLVEVKPKSQLKKPIPPKRRSKKSIETYSNSMKIWLVNMAKIEYAKAFCASRNWTFWIVTEDFFKLQNKR